MNCNVMHDYSIGNVVRSAKVRRVEGKSPEEFQHFHVGGTTLCADYARRALVRAAEITAECDRAQKKCKYSNNYPSSQKKSTKCSSIYV